MKPVATGGRRLGGRWVSEDAIRLVRAAGVDDPWTLVNPVCFREPLAPWTAARRARSPIHVSGVLKAVRALAGRHTFLILEGIGGLLVPLTARVTVADLAQRIGFPLVVVARVGLGTLNHTLLTLRCADASGLTVRAVILNEPDAPAAGRLARLAHRTNPAVLARLTPIPVLGPLPFRGAAQLQQHLGARAVEELLFQD